MKVAVTATTWQHCRISFRIPDPSIKIKIILWYLGIVASKEQSSHAYTYPLVVNRALPQTSIYKI
jgi:hypothetical protein